MHFRAALAAKHPRARGDKEKAARFDAHSFLLVDYDIALAKNTLRSKMKPSTITRKNAIINPKSASAE